MSIPLRGKRSSSDKSSGEKPHWVNPCPGVPTSSSSGTVKRSVSEEENTGSEADFINSIVLTSKHAIYQAETFRERYVSWNFNSFIWWRSFFYLDIILLDSAFEFNETLHIEFIPSTNVVRLRNETISTKNSPEAVNIDQSLDIYWKIASVRKHVIMEDYHNDDVKQW